MFVRVNQTPNSPRKSVQVVESRREGHKVKTKIIRHVGIALDDQELLKLKSFAQDIITKLKDQELSKQPLLFEGDQSSSCSLKKRGRPGAKKIEDILPLSCVTLDRIVEEKRIIEGVTDIAGPLYDALGFNTLLPTKRENHLLKSLVLARLVAPKSKRQLHKLLNNSFDQNCDLDALYRLMDKVYPRIDQIKRCVFNRTQELFPQGLNLMLFDVTTLYFESVTTDDLRQFGYSKDHRFNTTQVVLALATNEDGLPLGYEVFEGNTAEVRTLCAAIDKWRTNLPIKDICFVGDRGMFCAQNLELLEAKGYSYVVAAKLRSLPKDRQQEILDPRNYQVEGFAQEIGWVGEFDLGHRRLITSYKTKRALNDAKSRQQILDKITKVLDKSQETGKLISNKGIKKYTQTLSKSETVLDHDKIQTDADWDGMHGVITNIKDASAQEILQRYGRLWVIEESFRINKHNLKMRPIYHWKKERIESHVALCYMTFALIRHLQYQVSLTQKVSADEIMDELLNVQASIYVHTQTGDRYRVPGKTSQKASKIYKALGLIRSQNATIHQ